MWFAVEKFGRKGCPRIRGIVTSASKTVLQFSTSVSILTWKQHVKASWSMIAALNRFAENMMSWNKKGFLRNHVQSYSYCGLTYFLYYYPLNSTSFIHLSGQSYILIASYMLRSGDFYADSFVRLMGSHLADGTSTNIQIIFFDVVWEKKLFLIDTELFFLELHNWRYPHLRTKDRFFSCLIFIE